MPDKASFAMALAAIEDHYSKRIKKIENVMDGTERVEYPGSNKLLLQSLRNGGGKKYTVDS